MPSCKRQRPTIRKGAALFGKTTFVLPALGMAISRETDISKNINADKNLYCHKYLFVPINMIQYHWYLLVVVLDDDGIQLVVFDSIDNSDQLSKEHSESCTKMKEYIKLHLAEQKEQTDLIKAAYTYKRFKMDAQDDSYNCGIHMIATIYEIAATGTLAKPSMNTARAEKLRKYLLTTIVTAFCAAYNHKFEEKFEDCKTEEFNEAVVCWSWMFYASECQNKNNGILIAGKYVSIDSNTLQRLTCDPKRPEVCYLDGELLDLLLVLWPQLC